MALAALPVVGTVLSRLGKKLKRLEIAGVALELSDNMLKRLESLTEKQRIEIVEEVCKKGPKDAEDAARMLDEALAQRAPSSTWTRPPGWRLLKNGTWSGTPGHSDFIPTNPQVLGVPAGTKIPFRNGYPDFSQWSRGNLNVPGLTGNHATDMPLIYKAVARQQGLANATAARNWLSQQGLTPHHAGGNNVQLVPCDLHGGVRHMGGAWELRNQ